MFLFPLSKPLRIKNPLWKGWIIFLETHAPFSLCWIIHVQTSSSNSLLAFFAASPGNRLVPFSAAVLSKSSICLHYSWKSDCRADSSPEWFLAYATTQSLNLMSVSWLSLPDCYTSSQCHRHSGAVGLGLLKEPGYYWKIYGILSVSKMFNLFGWR